MDVFIGFDSAWTDNKRAPGAICAVAVEGARFVGFHPPVLATFAEAARFIGEHRSTDGATLIALDQPTIVPNATGARPVERLAASLMSWLGGGVQPANRGRIGMFCADAPLWRFLDAVGAVQDPEGSRAAASGLFIMEVFPAMALATFGTAFFGRRSAPRYNPSRRATFRPDDWPRVAAAAAAEAAAFGCTELANWCRDAGALSSPRKADQDRLDAALCMLIALHWRLRPRGRSMLLGDLATGYIVSPASDAVRTHLVRAASRLGLPVDGEVPQLPRVKAPDRASP